jgi:hypothetical protein
VSEPLPDDCALILQIPITLHKETGLDSEGKEVLKCGFRIGGGIDQDFRKSPQGYTDNVRGLFLVGPLFLAHPQTILYYSEYSLNLRKYCLDFLVIFFFYK